LGLGVPRALLLLLAMLASAALLLLLLLAMFACGRFQSRICWSQLLVMKQSKGGGR
jgi:hypothetical protein